ncbi:MAG: hypothetical protein R3342_13445 [Lutibacter sp.]|uniref:hypothetical protein n=1 Tax=Lutibacter sp. TaxID=1925666 RepID=UPI00299CE916|nr:hypothetical protein [Lutibacter sp.]MDX1830539.1 hypothetical protein [Lutibacter sp.]
MKRILIGFLLFITSQLFSQINDTVDYSKEIFKKDISNLFTLTKFNYGTSDEIIERAEPIGYIGETYQRFYFHLISVIKNKNTGEYFVYGKTKVKNNICEFQGLLIVDKANLLPNPEFPKIEQGIINGRYELFENPDQKGTGILEGTFQTGFYIDKNGELKYNSLMFSADVFCNNMFQGTWTSYKTQSSKKCNWGDYRIPESGDLDIGAGEFGPNSDYNEFGWENYTNAYFNYTNKTENEKALEIEKQKWWIKKH